SRIRLFRRDQRVSWEEVKVSLDFTKAKEVASPAEANDRRAGPRPKKNADHPVRDDLEGLWASAQVEHFAGLAGQVPEFGFHQFSSEATARKYNVPRLWVSTPWWGGRDERLPIGVGPGGHDLRDLYDMTTGATAIAESLALRRMLATG